MRMNRSGLYLTVRFTTTRICGSELLAKGHVFRTRTDTEVILHLYEEFGENCVQRLNGMFTFAIWDSVRRRLFLARDRLGIKPLFYSFEPGSALVFGSEIKTILEVGVSRKADPQALYDYLSLMYVPTPSTAFAAIKKLPPGCVMTCSREGLQIKQYWDIPLPRIGEEEPLGRHYEREILELIETINPQPHDCGCYGGRALERRTRFNHGGCCYGSKAPDAAAYIHCRI